MPENGYVLTTHVEGCAAAITFDGWCDCPSESYVPASLLDEARAEVERLRAVIRSTRDALDAPGDLIAAARVSMAQELHDALDRGTDEAQNEGSE